jgi:E3 ubiquitin-protein ligase DMA1/2
VIQQPCQCLFVAPCSHTWHYKCIRSLLASPSYPIFICPNCRAAADLDAEVEDPEEWEQLDSDEGDQPQEGALLIPNDSAENQASLAPPRKSRESVRSTSRQAQGQPQPQEADNGDTTMLLDPSNHILPQPDNTILVDVATNTDPVGRPTVSPYSTSTPVPIPTNAASQRAVSAGPTVPAVDSRHDARTPSPTGAPATNGHEGPITPRNDAGPWVFDGSGVRSSTDGGEREGPNGNVVHLNSLEAAVTDDVVMTT